MFMFFFATMGCGVRERQGGRGCTPAPEGETWVRFPGDEELFVAPKATMWPTQRQAKEVL